MLLEGQGAQLYDADVQRQFQARYAGRVGTLYIHPPFETLAYSIVAWLPLKQAYLLWCLLSFALLACAMHTLARAAPSGWDGRLLLAASVTFVPVLLCFLQGQDSILLLLTLTLSFAALRSGRGSAAGCWLALGLFKFQLVIPLALVFAVRKGRGRFLLGFALVALGLAALCAGISGWRVFLLYPKFLLHLQEQPFAGVMPSAMANFRGLVFVGFGSNRSPFAIASLTVLCSVACVMTLWAWRNTVVSEGSGTNRGLNSTAQPGFDLAVSASLLFALLVSYHLNPHDLTLLLLPMVLLLQAGVKLPGSRTFMHRVTFTVVAALFVPPLHIIALRSHEYTLVSIVLIGCFAVSVFLADRAVAGGRP